MIKLYVKKVREGIISLNDVPEKWREEVRKIVEGN